ASVPPQGGRKHPQHEYIQVNTRNILVICGGAFDGLEKIIEARTGHRRIGCGNGSSARAVERKNPFRDVEQEDLLGVGLLPELVGRRQVAGTREALNEDGLVRSLTEPKYALPRQYEEMFG